MTRTIKTASQGYLSESLDLVEKVFTDSKDESTLKFYENAGYSNTDKTAFIQWLK